MKKSKANDLALLIDEGMAVFPLARNTKVPLKDSSGFKDATTNLKEARRIFTENPEANIGVATGPASGVVVLDVDVIDKYGNPKPGKANLRKLERDVGTLSKTTLVRTTTGGQHYWFEYHGKDIRDSESKLALGLDIRGDGGYVVEPHSTINGKKYEWVNGLYRRKPLPDDLHELILKAKKGKRTQTDDEEAAETSADKKASDPTLCREALHAIKQIVKDWDNYGDCIDVGRAIRGAELERKDWHEWAAKSDKYTEAWADEKWDSFKPPHKSGAGSIFYWAEQSGWVRPKSIFVPETEGGLATLFIQQHGRDVRYDEVKETWYAWNGTLWVRQPKKAADIQERVKTTIFSIISDAFKLDEDSDKQRRKEKLLWGFKSDRKQVMRGAMDLAASDPKLRISMDKLDRDPLLLGTLSGIIDLRTGKLIKAARENLVTRSVAVAFDHTAECPAMGTVHRRGHDEQANHDRIHTAAGRLPVDWRQSTAPILFPLRHWSQR
jgi:putative DNA primase/helicase